MLKPCSRSSFTKQLEYIIIREIAKCLDHYVILKHQRQQTMSKYNAYDVYLYFNAFYY
jgi:hypothetical protein